MKAHIKTLLMVRTDISRIAHSEGQQGEDLGCFLSKLVLKTTPAKISVVYGKSKCRRHRALDLRKTKIADFAASDTSGSTALRPACAAFT